MKHKKFPRNKEIQKEVGDLDDLYASYGITRDERELLRTLKTKFSAPTVI